MKACTWDSMLPVIFDRPQRVSTTALVEVEHSSCSKLPRTSLLRAISIRWGTSAEKHWETKRRAFAWIPLSRDFISSIAITRIASLVWLISCGCFDTRSPNSFRDCCWHVSILLRNPTAPTWKHAAKSAELKSSGTKLSRSRYIFSSKSANHA